MPAGWQARAGLKNLLALRLEVCARWLVRVETEDELVEAVRTAGRLGLNILLLGGGTNLVLQGDFPGLVIQMGLRGLDVDLSGSDDSLTLRVGAGEDWPALVQHCLEEGWYGLENLSLIPGTVGAAPVRNIGAYGAELSDCLEAVEVLDIEASQVRTLSAGELELGYRTSSLLRQRPLRFAVTAVHLRLCRSPRINADHPALKQALADRGLGLADLSPKTLASVVCQLRRCRLPDPAELPNVGSFFTNPMLDKEHWRELLQKVPDVPWRERGSHYQVAAAHLIEQAGWKGHDRGDVGVSNRHALVLVNRGGSGEKLLELAADIAADVRERFGVNLEPEPAIY